MSLNGPERSHSFMLSFCKDPGCGIHMTALRANGSVICESVISLKQTKELAEIIHDFLYHRVALRDDEDED